MKVTRISEEAAARGGGDNFIGEVNVQPLVAPEQGLDIVLVSFSPGARTYLHAHEAPQVLHCMRGSGMLATESERNAVGPGDIVYVPAGEMHWHGAGEDSAFVHLSIRAPGATRWTRRDPLAKE
jgi:quercetin dioxygenase-like cupin family protein